jgi:hypothetical protein
MVYFKTKNVNFGILWKASGWKILVFFNGNFWYIIWPSGIFLAILLHFSQFFSTKEKSGNPL